MSSTTVKSRWQDVFLPLFSLLVAGWALRPLESCFASPRLQSAQAVQLSGSGLLGVLGGMRSVVAGGLWLRTYQAWERQDAVGLTALLQLTVTADDRPPYFWLNGARMLAYDLPAWVCASDAPESVRRKAAADGAARACSFLEEGRKAHPLASEFLIEMANIQLRAGGDREMAADLFRQAADLPGAPHYAARIHGELLRELGRPHEALAWLQQILPGLPADDPAACRGVVEQRIKALEAELGEK
jgi:hypothetical protein